MSFIKNILRFASLKSGDAAAVILAAGLGERFGNEDGTKQNAPVGGIPALVRCALAFEECDMIKEVVIVAREDEIPRVEGYVRDYDLKKVSNIVPGGATRQESSEIGFYASSGKCRFVAIHDAARCLVTRDIIERTLLEAFKYGAAAAAERVVDTVKIATGAGFIERTEDREHVWLVKTPQVFKRSVYETALALAKRDGISVTDDCMMAEHARLRVKLVDCGHENIKLTERDDLGLAEYILSKREGKEI